MCWWPLWVLTFVSPEVQLQRSCSSCHKLDVVRAQHLTRWEWSRELDKMTAMGAKIEHRKQLLEYLARNFGNK
jgi:hypothetical protein